MGLLAYLKTQFVVHLLIGFVFVVSGLIINFTQLCTLALWPISKNLYRRINCRLAYSLWSRKCPPTRALYRAFSGRATPDTPSQPRAWYSSGSLRSPLQVNRCPSSFPGLKHMLFPYQAV